MFLADAQRPSRTVAPVVVPVSLDEAKAHCNVYHSDDDALLQGYVDAAVAHLDGLHGVLGRCLISQTWQVKARAWPTGDRFLLPVPDVSAVTIAYRDTSGASQTWASSNWHLTDFAAESAIVLDADATWPDLDEHPAAVTVTLTAGFGATADEVPAAIRQAILLLVSTWFQNREAYAVGQAVSAPLPFAVAALIAPYRRVGI